MAKRPLEDVFKVSGTPTYTFVRPTEYTQLLVALRTPGRGVVIEGPSGIGKTTAVTKALDELGLNENVLKLSGRRSDDVEMIRELPNMQAIGTVIVDDFHKLDDSLKQSIADYMKVLADEERTESKVVIVGINKAGESLVSFAHDLNNRLAVIPFEANPVEKVREMIGLGENVLNITINVADEIAESANGSFYVAQMLSHHTCVSSGIIEQQDHHANVNVSFETIRGKVFEDLSRTFLERTRTFARGTRFRREGRAPYLHILYWLAMSDGWSLSLREAIIRYPNFRNSLNQIAENDYLVALVDSNADLSDVFYYDKKARLLTVEDPQYIYFLRNLSWSKFAEELGFVSIDFPSRYDFALSFAGADRDVAKALCEALQEFELEVFYDKNEQHRILAENVEDYLRPIYQSDAQFVVALLGRDYPNRIWTKFESDQFRERFGQNSVIPIWFSDAPPGMFDATRKVGGLEFDRTLDLKQQIDGLAEVLRKKLAEARSAGSDK